jgi:hypothetical protein
MRDIHVHLTRVCKLKALDDHIVGWPRAAFVPIALTTYVIKVGIVNLQIRKLAGWAEMVDFEELFTAQIELRALTVCQTK